MRYIGDKVILEEVTLNIVRFWSPCLGQGDTRHTVHLRVHELDDIQACNCMQRESMPIFVIWQQLELELGELAQAIEEEVGDR
jgi:hypothetical protein